MNFNRYLLKVKDFKNRIFLNEIEKKFIKKNKNLQERNSRKIIVVQITEDYFCLINTLFLLKNKKFSNYKLVGLWTSCLPRKKGFINFIKFCVYLFVDILIKLKWFKLYKSIGIEKIYNLNNNFLSNLILSRTNFLKYNSSLKNKHQILNIKYQNLWVGDLIYDYYLRYFQKYTFHINDKIYLKKILNYTEHSIINLKKILNKNQIKFYIPQQAANYIQCGLPIRFFLNNNIETIGCDNISQYVKKFTKNDFFSNINPVTLKKNLNSIKNKKKILSIGKKRLNQKFNGKINPEIVYMKKSPYEKNKIKISKNFDAVIFLPNFDDAQHCNGKFIFTDFYDWIHETLNFLKIKKINVAIKPHPNETYNSSNFVNYLKKKFLNFIWLDEFTSNKLIFSKKPLFGISVYGTVLHELAYHNIIPISAGNHSAVFYNFIFSSKSKNHYFKLINLAIKKKLKLPKNYKTQIAEYYYMLNIHNNDYLDNLSRQVNLRKYKSVINSNNIASLKRFNEERL